MADNTQRWIRNLLGAKEPHIMRGKFVAGATTAIKRGEIIELTANTATTWVPLDSDFAMDSDVAIMNEEIKSGDLAGYYEIIVPRPGDVFEFALAAAGADLIGAAMYFSDSETVTRSAGSNIIGRSIGQTHYPQKQGHASDDASGDRGTTVRSISTVHMVFRDAVSYWSLAQSA